MRDHQQIRRLHAFAYLGVIAALVFLAAFLNLICGCSAVPATSAPTANPIYQLVLGGSLDGVAFSGTAIGSSVPSHVISISSNVDVNMFTAQTCHRSLSFPDVISQGWITKNRTYKWSYKESPGIEDTGDCILRLCAYSKTVGALPVSCAAIDFKAGRYILPGENICNGADGITTGTATCHSLMGLTERVKFPIPVTVAAGNLPNQCLGSFIDTPTNSIWEYQIPKNECVVIFMEIGKPHRRSKLTVIPYDTPSYLGGK